jgi:hypothetical protein
MNHKEAIKTPLKQRATDAKLPEQPTSALIPSSNQPNHVKNANTNHKEAIKTPLKQGSTDAKLPGQPTSALIRSSKQPNHVKKLQHDV